MKYTEILSENTKLEKQLKNKRYSIRVLSNIVVNQLGEVLEYFSRKSSVPAEVSFGDYDNVIQDSFNNTSANLVIIFWDLSNFIDLKIIFKNSPNIIFYSFYFFVLCTKLLMEILLKQSQ